MSRRVLGQPQIMRAAVEVADAGGLDAVTITAVARKLGVTPPSLYKHVEGREGLVQLLATRAVLDVAKVMESAIAGRSGRDAVLAASAAFRDYVLRHPGVWDATLPRPGGAPEPTSLQIAAHHRMHEVFQSMLRAWPAAGEMQRLHTIRSLQASLHGFVLLERAGGYNAPGVGVTRSFETLVASVLAALGPAGSSPPAGAAESGGEAG